MLTCTGDLNGIDGVNSTDLGILLSSWSVDADSLALGCGGADSCPSDLNCDGAVNSLDLGILLAAWGRCPGQSIMSPEGPTLDDLIVIFCDLGHEDMIAILVQVWDSMH
jgi:hypothetical protein